MIESPQVVAVAVQAVRVRIMMIEVSSFPKHHDPFRDLVGNIGGVQRSKNYSSRG